MSDYATTEQVAAFAQEFDALGTAGQDQLISGASRLFDRLCEVEDDFFAAAAGESDKVFFGDGTAYLKLPPYVSLGTDPIVIVDINDDELEVPDYLEQDGHLVIRDEGIRARSVVPDTFTGWPLNQEITVSANWGFATVPSDVTQAVIQLAILTWRQSDPAFARMSQSGQVVEMRELPLVVQNTIEKYRQKYSKTAIFA